MEQSPQPFEVGPAIAEAAPPAAAAPPSHLKAFWQGAWPRLLAVLLLVGGWQLVVWSPRAILIFQLSGRAILFVVILGAAPALTNGLIAGMDHIPPQLLRAGRALGARRLQLYRFVVLPAALPGYVAGLKQGWAFA